MYKLLKQLSKVNSLHSTAKPNLYGNSIGLLISRNFNTSGTMFKASVFNLQDASKDQVQEFLNSFDTVLTDCDGKIKL